MSDDPNQRDLACVRFNNNVRAFFERFGMENVNPVVDQLREFTLMWMGVGDPIEGDLLPRVSGIIEMMRRMELSPAFFEALALQQ